MSRSRTSLPRLVTAIAVLLVGTTACTPQEPEVSINDQVAAADRVPEDAGEATAGGEQPAAGGEVIQWAADNDLDYDVAPDAVPAGEQLVFELELTGLPHNVVIEELGDELVVGGESAGTYTGQVSLDAGEYTYYCSVAGHRAAGMEGTLVAQ